MTWLRSRPRFSVVAACAGLAVVFAVDLLVPGYVPAAGYLVLLTFAAVALRRRPALVIAGAGLALTLTVMVLQGRTGGENLLLVWLGVLAGVGVLALVLLFGSVEELYEAEREHARRAAAVDARLAFQAHLLANVHDAVLALDPECRVTYWNDAAAGLFGLPGQTMLGRPLTEALSGAFRTADLEAWETALRRDDGYRADVLLLDADSDGRWLDAHARAIRGEGAELEGFVVSLRDIDEKRKAQEALAVEAARVRAILDAAPVGLGIVDRTGAVLVRNDVLRRIWAGEATVRSVAEFEAYKAFWPETGQRLASQEWPAAKALADGSSFNDVIVTSNASTARRVRSCSPRRRSSMERASSARSPSFRTSRACARPSSRSAFSPTRSGPCTRAS